MKLRLTERAERDFQDLPDQVRARVEKQLRFLLIDRSHPSLHAKKYDESEGVFQGRATRDWRFYFRVEGDTYVILRIIPHPK